jgi:hypothetical protein
LVLVTEPAPAQSTDPDPVFAFILEPLGPPVVPSPSIGPLVEVTPPAGEPLTLVATLTAPVMLTAQVTPAIPAGNGAAAAVDESAAGLLAQGLSALGAVLPAWVPALLTRLLGSAPPEEPAGEAVVEAGREPGDAAETPRPPVDGLDLEQQLRELDLYQPTPSPDRPDPTSGRPGERRGQELLARAPAVDALTPLADRAVASEEGESLRPMAGLAEVVEATAADLGAGAMPEEVSDAVLVQTRSAWGEESWRLLGVVGLVLWPWPACGCQCENQAQTDPERERERLANGKAGGGMEGASRHSPTGRRVG